MFSWLPNTSSGDITFDFYIKGSESKISHKSHTLHKLQTADPKKPHNSSELTIEFLIRSLLDRSVSRRPLNPHPSPTQPPVHPSISLVPPHLCGRVHLRRTRPEFDRSCGAVFLISCLLVYVRWLYAQQHTIHTVWYRREHGANHWKETRTYMCVCGVED